MQATAVLPSGASPFGVAEGCSVAHLIVVVRSVTFMLIAFAWAKAVDDPPETWRRWVVEGNAETEPTTRAPANPPATTRYQSRIMVSI